MWEDFFDIKKKLKKKLDYDRFEHTLSVAYTSAALAMRYGCDVKRAALAGLLHDCGKYGSSGKIYEKCVKFKIPITEEEKKNPSLLHGKLGAYYARKKYHIEDEEILSAISCHTTGKPDMTLLEKIVFVADYIEPLRTKDEHLPQIREKAFCYLDGAICIILRNTLKYLKEKKVSVDNITKETYEYYKNLTNRVQ